MSIKITEQNGRVLIRRWAYDPEKKRSMPTTIASLPGGSYSLPTAIPADKIEKFGVTKEEQEQYQEYYQKRQDESKKEDIASCLNIMNYSLERILEALEDSTAVSQLELDHIEKCSSLANEVKKKLTDVKSKRVRAMKRKNKKLTLTSVK